MSDKFPIDYSLLITCNKNQALALLYLKQLWDKLIRADWNIEDPETIRVGVEQLLEQLKTVGLEGLK